MTNMKHTPGPWETDERDHTDPYQAIRIGPSGNYRVCRVWLDDCAHDYNPEQRANARLIAAAPDLLAALKEAADPVSGYLHGPALDRALAAIAKAEGRTSD